MPRPDEQSPAEKSWNPVPEKATMLGPTIVASGELAGQEDLVIKGTFKGKIQLPKHSLFIEAGAQVEAEIAAVNVILNGNLTGSILASGKVQVSSSGRMKGDITAAKVSVLDGAQFKGSIKIRKGNA
jgi:cytoskeletal protein CcmA (bactofilin family)